MKRFFFTALFLLSLSGLIAQSTTDKVFKIANTQTARISVDFVDEKGVKLPSEFGKGIVLNGKYFLTCYHLIVPKVANAKLDKIYMIYNERQVKGRIVVDSMLLIKDFFPNKDQYDFRSHDFIQYNYETDCIVLKLQKPLKPLSHRFAINYPNSLDALFCMGNVEENNIMYQKFQAVNYLFKYNPTTSNPFFLTYLSAYTHGFSGTPLYNQKGEILGIVQYSIEVLNDQLIKWELNNTISVEMANIISKGYLQGLKLQCAIDFTYLKSKYLKGYL